MKVKTYYAGKPYITPGEEYDATPLGDGGFEIKVTESLYPLYCLPKRCAHLEGGDWIIVDEKPMTATEVWERREEARLGLHPLGAGQVHTVSGEPLPDPERDDLQQLIAERDALQAQLDELQEWVDLIKRHKGDQYLIINRHNDYPYHAEEFDYRFSTKQEVMESLKYIRPGQARVVEIGRVLGEKEIVSLCEQKSVDSQAT